MNDKPTIYVDEATEADIDWPFAGLPRFRYGGRGASIEVDPFPCYSHDRVAVREIADRLARLFPPANELTIHVAHFECTGRTNGWSQQLHVYGDDERVPEGHIFLSGKRIPLHPAMTRYLVAHEYGHHVQYWLERRLGLEREELLDEYSKLRGLRPVNGAYGGRTWHRSPGEVFACDFRILVGGVEPEFWPHDGIEYPTASTAATAFWNQHAGSLGAAA